MSRLCSRSTHAIMATEAALRAIAVNPKSVVFKKSTYPATGEEVVQFSEDC